MRPLLQHRRVRALVALQAADYLCFLLADLLFAGAGVFSVVLKYIAILLCVAMAISLHRLSWNRRDSALLIAALSLTCIADLFLLILGRPVPGLLAFCAVHVVYIRRYRPALFPPAAIIVLLLAPASLAAGVLIPGFPAQTVLAGLYGLLILTVTVCSFWALLPRPNRRLVCIGMVLFLLCDIHVALFNSLSMGNPYFPFAAFLMWFFYLPAQILLACSSFHFADIAEKR